MLTTIALTALMTTSAQAERAPTQDIAAVDVNLRPADGELIPSNARMVAVPTYGSVLNLDAELTVGAGAAAPLTLAERCTADGTTCLYEASLEGLVEDTGATLTLSGDVNRSEVYAVGAADVTPPKPEFEGTRPSLLAVVNDSDEVDHFVLAFNIQTLSFDDDVALLEVQEIGAAERQAIHLSVRSADERLAEFDAPLLAMDGEACVALILHDVAGNTTTVEGDDFCRTLSREEADDEVLLENNENDIAVGPFELFCNHMGTEKTTPVGLGAALFGLLALTRRRRR